MFDRDDLPTLPYPALSAEMTQLAIRLPELMPLRRHEAEPEDLTVEDMEPPTRVLSNSLPGSAKEAFEAFCDSERIPEWMPIIQSSRVISRYRCGRPKRTAFLARLERSSMGYTMHYEYDEDTLTVRWCNGLGASTRISGSAQFTPMGRRSCMMHYELDVQSEASLPPWGDPMYNGHPASSVVGDFRDFLRRTWG